MDLTYVLTLSFIVLLGLQVMAVEMLESESIYTANRERKTWDDACLGRARLFL